MHVDAQAEHNKSQNTLFELTSQKEERETSRQHEAEQAANDLEEAHKKLRQVGRCKQHCVSVVRLHVFSSQRTDLTCCQDAVWT